MEELKMYSRILSMNPLECVIVRCTQDYTRVIGVVLLLLPQHTHESREKAKMYNRNITKRMQQHEP